MLLSTNQELRLHIPSNAVDDVSLLQGILDNSEKDFLKDKLGAPLYDQLCEYYRGVSAEEFYVSVTNGSYSNDPWAVLLLTAQRMITNDALARFAFQQVISVNGSGVNVVSGNDYGPADDRLLDKGVGGYKKEAAIACNNLLVLLEDWAKATTVPDVSPSGTPNGDPTSSSAITEIINLWKQSKYYYFHSDLLIPTCSVLQHYLDIYDNRDKFIRLLPDLNFIQEEYIEEAFGETFVKEMLATVPDVSPLGMLTTVPDASPSGPPNGVPTPPSVNARLLKKVRRLMVAYLEQRTTVLGIDKNRRLQAHDEAVSLKDAILAMLKEKETEAPEEGVPTPTSSSEGYQNNQEGSKIFVTPLLY